MESSLALTVIGLTIIAVTVGILIRGKIHPIVAMSLIPVLGAVIAGFGIGEIEEFFQSGLERVMGVVVMFIFAIVYFGIMQEAGLFTPIINRLIRMTRGKVVFVTLGTAAIATIAHLDGAGASTFLITIPALLPLYEALRMSKYTLLAITALSASVMNMVPWAGPTGRAASVIESSPEEIWQHLISAQIAALFMVFVVAFGFGLVETRRIKKLELAGASDGSSGGGSGSAGSDISSVTVDVNAIADDFVADENSKRRELGLDDEPTRISKIINLTLTFILLAILVTGLLSPATAFLLGTAIALLVNYRTNGEQTAALKRHAPAALSMAGVILAAAMFLGILNGSGMLESIAISLISVMPESIGAYLHLIVGLLGVPLDLMTSTDAYYFSVLPIVEQTSAAYGVTPLGVASAMILGNVIGTFVSPFSPALWLAIGLANANMGRHIKIAFPIAWVFSIILVLFAWATGLLV